MARTMIAVVGGYCVDADVQRSAHALGRRIAEAGWVLLTGGRDGGVMAAATRGANEAGGLTVGVLPGIDCQGAADGLDIAIVTGMGDARNVINVLSANVVVALQGESGTLSEIALAIKNDKPVVLLDLIPEFEQAAKKIGGRVISVSNIDAATKQIRKFLSPKQ